MQNDSLLWRFSWEIWSCTPHSALNLKSHSSNLTSKLEPEASDYHNKTCAAKHRLYAGSVYNDRTDSITLCLLNLDTDVKELIRFLSEFQCSDICPCLLPVWPHFLWNRNKCTDSLKARKKNWKHKQNNPTHKVIRGLNHKQQYNAWTFLRIKWKKNTTMAKIIMQSRMLFSSHLIFALEFLGKTGNTC